MSSHAFSRPVTAGTRVNGLSYGVPHHLIGETIEAIRNAINGTFWRSSWYSICFQKKSCLRLTVEGTMERVSLMEDVSFIFKVTVYLQIDNFLQISFFWLNSNDPNEISNAKKKSLNGLNIGREMAVLSFDRK